MISLVDRVLLVTMTDAAVLLHARDDLDDHRLRKVLDAAGTFWMPAADAGDRLLPRVTDVTHGAAAARALEVLVAGGWQLRWHPRQPVDQRPRPCKGSRSRRPSDLGGRAVGELVDDLAHEI